MTSERQSHRKAEIVMVATNLFKARGFHGTRMDDIADAAGLNKATVYYYYRSKAHILFDIYLKATSESLALLDDSDEEISPARALVRHTRRTLELVAANPAQASVYFQESPFIEEWLTAEQVTEIRSREVAYERSVRAIIERGMQDGSFLEADPVSVTAAYVGMTSWFYRWYDPRRSGRPEAIADQFSRVILRGTLKVPDDVDHLGLSEPLRPKKKTPAKRGRVAKSGR